jgi:hypothetical protein
MMGNGDNASAPHHSLYRVRHGGILLLRLNAQREADKLRQTYELFFGSSLDRVDLDP